MRIFSLLTYVNICFERLWKDEFQTFISTQKLSLISNTEKVNMKISL